MRERERENVCVYMSVSGCVYMSVYVCVCACVCEREFVWQNRFTYL